MKSLLRILDMLCLVLSPIAVIFFILSIILLPIQLREHPSYTTRLEQEGLVTTATVIQVYDDGDAYIEYESLAGMPRSAILKMTYYDAPVRNAVQPETRHRIRYLPDESGNPILDAHIDAVRAYRKPLDGLFILLGVSWLILVVRPDILFIGYMNDWSALEARRLSFPDVRRES